MVNLGAVAQKFGIFHQMIAFAFKAAWLPQIVLQILPLLGIPIEL